MIAVVAPNPEEMFELVSELLGTQKFVITSCMLGFKPPGVMYNQTAEANEM
jgi:hypothetical protein